MGEEEKKPEEKPAVEEKKKVEEEKKVETEPKKPEEEKKKEEDKEKKEEKGEKGEKEAPPPEEIVLKAYMHCEGCARKVKRSLRGFEGVEDVKTDCKSHTVVVKGKNADPVKVCERIQRKSGRKVELISPLPKPKEEKKKEEKEIVKPEEKKEEPVVIIVVLKVHMHCEACSQEIKKRIQKMKGVQSVEPDLKSAQVTVKGVFDPQALVQYVYKRTGKHAVILKQEPEKKEEKVKEGKEEEKKSEGGEAKKEEEKGGEGDQKEKKEGEEGGKADEEAKLDLKKSDFYPYFYPTFTSENEYTFHNVHAPQIFSDENPNACSVM